MVFQVVQVVAVVQEVGALAQVAQPQVQHKVMQVVTVSFHLMVQVVAVVVLVK
jgi:hypothetical protein